MSDNFVRPLQMASILLRAALRFGANRRGNIGIMTAILIVPLVGAMGLATEGAGWVLVNRAAQHAADSAALAAATNNDGVNGACAGGFATEATAVAANLGFPQKPNITTVSACDKIIAAIPKCAAGCYEVVVKHNIPLFLSPIVGYTGVALGAGRGTTVQAVAVARTVAIPGYDCILSLGTASDAIHFNGGPKMNFTGCTLRSDGGVTCDGQNAGGDAYKFIYGPGGSDKNGGCSTPPTLPSVQAPNLADPYSVAGGCGAVVDGMVKYPCYGSNIPSQPAGCVGANPYHNEVKGGKGAKGAASLPNSNLLKNLTGIPANPICGDAALSEDVTVSGNAVLVIENGVLDLNGHTLSTAAGGGLTVVFSGPSGGSVGAPVDNASGGVLDIAAPDANSGSVWKGVAIWQDASLTTGPGINYTLSGANPTLKVTGLVYMPNANVTISGAIDKSTSGQQCFALVDKTTQVNGSGSIFAFPTLGCKAAGLDPPQGVAGNGAELVF